MSQRNYVSPGDDEPDALNRLNPAAGVPTADVFPLSEPCARCNGTREIIKVLRYTGEPLRLDCPDCCPKKEHV